MIYDSIISAGIGILCFMKSIINATIYQILEYFMLLSSNKLDNFLFQKDLVPAYTIKTTSNWFADTSMTV